MITINLTENAYQILVDRITDCYYRATDIDEMSRIRTVLDCMNIGKDAWLTKIHEKRRQKNEQEK